MTTTTRMPAIFFGHGNPMNALVDNEWTARWEEIGRTLPRPQAIVCISAHWYLPGTHVTAVERPRTIHDFGGFPPALYEITYPCAGDPELAQRLIQRFQHLRARGDETMSLDHGAWSLLHHLFPKADVPCLQLAISKKFTLREHFELATQLSELASEGYLIIGSGNVVHNLGEIAWEDDAKPFAWAEKFEADLCTAVVDRGSEGVVQLIESNPTVFRQAHPTTEHFLPLVYALGAAHSRKNVSTVCRGIQNGSISMLGFIWNP